MSEQTALANVDDLDPTSALDSGENWKAQLMRWQEIHRSGLLPKHIRDARQALVISLKGAEIGLSPMVALESIYVINGKTELNAETMWALCHERCPEMSYELEQADSEGVIGKVRRSPDHPWVPVSYTMEDAARAGLDASQTWRKYPADMLWARWVSRVRRRVFPEVAKSAYVRGEVDQAITVSQVETVDDLTELVPAEVVG